MVLEMPSASWSSCGLQIKSGESDEANSSAGQTTVRAPPRLTLRFSSPLARHSALESFRAS